MKNKILIIFSVQLLFCSYTLTLDQARTGKIENLTDKVSPSSEVLKKISEHTPEASDVSQDKTSEELLQALDIFSTINRLKNLTIDAYKATIAIKEYLQGKDAGTTPEELRYLKKCQYLMAKKALKDCLIKNARSKINSHGRPQECEELAQMFLIMGNSEDLERLNTIFKQTRKKHGY